MAELFEEIRREYEFGVGTIQGVARKFGVHRCLMLEALQNALPVEKAARPRLRPKLSPVAPFIDAILETDRQAPRKQQHTAHRIYLRIQQELAQCPIAESTVRRYVRERKAALGLLRRETFVPQSYPWGTEAQVDWYEAAADLGGERLTRRVAGTGCQTKIPMLARKPHLMRIIEGCTARAQSSVSYSIKGASGALNGCAMLGAAPPP